MLWTRRVAVTVVPGLLRLLSSHRNLPSPNSSRQISLALPLLHASCHTISVGSLSESSRTGILYLWVPVLTTAPQSII